MHPVLATPLSPSRWPRSFRIAGVAIVWALLAVYFHTPVREAMSPGLDASNYASYTYFTAHNFQYGTEVVPMAGPYGFLMYGWTYSGELFGLRTAGELLLNGVLAALTLWFLAANRSWVRWLWFAAHLLFTSYTEDLPLEWILLLSGLCLLDRPPGGRLPWLSLLVTAAMALVSLVKGTQLILGLATLGVVLGAFVWQRQWRHAARLAAGYVASLLGFWLLAGQNPLHLPAYIHGIMELGGGYTAAMSIPTPEEALPRMALTFVALLAAIAWPLWHRRREAAVVAALLLLAGHSFVQWKHGIVRSDGHIQIFFAYAAPAALAIHLAGWRKLLPGTPDLVVWRGAGLTLVALVAAKWGAVGYTIVRWDTAPGLVAARWAKNADYLLHLGPRRAQLDQELRWARRSHSMPQVVAAVGQRPVDGFGYEQGLLLLNQLDYRPRPMGGGSFNVYTPYLMALNRAFLRDDARRPDFYLLRPQTIDGRLLAADDGRALVEILQRYRPVLFEHEHLLMAATPEPAAPEPRSLARGRTRFGQMIEVPAAAPGELTLTRFSVRLNWRGAIRSLLYKPPMVFIELYDRAGGSLGKHRIIPAMAESPFLISPQVETPADVIELYGREPGREVARFRVSSPIPFPFALLVDYEFLATQRPRALPADALTELRGRLQFPFANVLPEAITPAFRPHPAVRFMHPPSEAVWRLGGAERAFSFHYGIDPEAYERGTTNGVDFMVEIRGPAGGVQPVFKRSLQPRKNPADAGDQETNLTLPVFLPGSQLVVRTGPGEYGDTSWDWAYINRIELQSGGAYAADMFPGFNRVPDAAAGENTAALDFEGGRVLLLHVPGTMRFNLTGRETKLAFDFGFLPGAYTEGGNTSGADYIVELQSPGQAPRELARRALRPVPVPADRGGQTHALTLPPVQAGDVLIVRTAPAPGGSSSWGWTYFSRLTLE